MGVDSLTKVSIFGVGQRMAAGEKKFRLEESPGTAEQDAG